MTTKNYYLKHPNSDEMSEFTTLENWMNIRVSHFIHWGKARADSESKVVEIDEAREVWKKLVGHGYVRETGAEIANRERAIQHRSQSESNKNLNKHKSHQLEIGQK